MRALRLRSSRLILRPPAGLYRFVRFAERRNVVSDVCHHISNALYLRTWCIQYYYHYYR